jgi:putative transposase
MGCRVEDRESDDLAVEMFETAFGQHGAPLSVHADNGPAMRSGTPADLLTNHKVTTTHNRPYASNDNTFSESEFRTMKYRPYYPGPSTVFRPHATTWPSTCPGATRTTNTPASRCSHPNDGSWRQVHRLRDCALQKYHQKHPERFRARPKTPAPADIVGINIPDKTVTK